MNLNDSFWWIRSIESLLMIAHPLALFIPGHWLNLLHVFSGGCSPPGDLVDDTNPQSAFVGRIGGLCPGWLPDSCPAQPGRDNLHNMMDYNPVQCPDEFTQGQIQRMHDAWEQFRA